MHLRHWMVAIATLLVMATAAGGQSPDASSAPMPDASYALTVQQLQSVLSTEKKAVEDIGRRVRGLEQLSEIFTATINAWRIQGTSYRNLLVLPQAKPSVLNKALGELQASLEGVEEKISTVAARVEEINTLKAETEQQLNVYHKNLEDVESGSSTSLYQPAVRTELESLIQYMGQKKHYLELLTAIRNRQMEDLGTIRTEFAELVPQLADRIRNLQTRALFTRTNYPFDFTSWARFTGELNSLAGRFRLMGTQAFWGEEFRTLRRYEGHLLLAAGLLYGGLLFLARRFKRLLAVWQQAPELVGYPGCQTLLHLLSRSLFPGATILFLSIYTATRGIPGTVPIIAATVNILLTMLGTRWFIDLLKIDGKSSKPRIPLALNRLFRVLLLMVRVIGVSYITIAWLLPDGNPLLVLARLLFEILLMLWILNFHRAHRTLAGKGQIQASARWVQLQPLMNGLILAIPGVALVMELLGYGTLSLFWFIGWGRTLAILLWAVLLYVVLNEWDQKLYPRARTHPEGSAQPVKWLLFRLCWLGWSAALALGLIFAWGGQRAVAGGLQKVIHYTVAIGDLQLNLLRLLQAFLILFVTHLIVRTGRHALTTKLLAKSGLDKGLRSSIVTMCMYLAWGLGILAALYALGFSGTSLTVAFGALSIGLGFGLQNIFNNFISGIIMLFERPIEVGDAIEINGIWGEVQKINFRSTVVRTYDNAALIIPNSDFISNQVTNWSFRDQRLRIKIPVGVAYGSDPELVRRTLLEAADQVPHILKYPPPDVHFLDFADNSLNFILRVWTDIDNMLNVGTAIRMEIDRLFKAHGLEIPFPQRDLHLRTAPDEQQVTLSGNGQKRG